MVSYLYVGIFYRTEFSKCTEHNWPDDQLIGVDVKIKDTQCVNLDLVYSY